MAWGKSREETTDPDGRKMFKQAGRHAAVGLEIGIAMAIGLIGGNYLDSKLDTKPIFFWIGFCLGIGAAVKALVDTVRAAKRELADNDEPPTKRH